MANRLAVCGSRSGYRPGGQFGEQGSRAALRLTATKLDARLPIVAGGLSLALARTFQTIDPQLENSTTEQWAVAAPQKMYLAGEELTPGWRRSPLNGTSV